MPLDNAVLFNVPMIPDDRGNLSFFQYPDQLPFEINKVFWVNNIPAGTEMPGQANKQIQEIIIALSGSFDVIISDGVKEKKYTLTHPGTYLYIPKMIWRRLVNFSTNSVVFIASEKSDIDIECITDLAEYKLIKDASSL